MERDDSFYGGGGVGITLFFWSLVSDWRDYRDVYKHKILSVMKDHSMVFAHESKVQNRYKVFHVL